MSEKVVGVDLLWVRPGKVGGTESFVRNLLEGFRVHAPTNVYFKLFCTEDNISSFERLSHDGFIELINCKVKSEPVWKRILFENIKLDKLAQVNKVQLMYIPVYSMPFSDRQIPYVVTIHDLQALHYPNYFSYVQRQWLRYSWRRTVKNAKYIVAISDFVKQDIIDHYDIDQKKIKTIYNPVLYEKSNINTNIIKNKYNVKAKEYLYTISSLLPHKNLLTLLKMVQIMKDKFVVELPSKLIISGIGAGKEKDFLHTVKSLGIEDSIMLTGYISTEERNALMENSFCFLFPSIFEGFGMPPVEAMMAGINVITTKCTAIPEITKQKAEYVENPYDSTEWLGKINSLIGKKGKVHIFPDYKLNKIASEYLDLFEQIE